MGGKGTGPEEKGERSEGIGIGRIRSVRGPEGERKEEGERGRGKRREGGGKGEEDRIPCYSKPL